ncbi:lysophospholipid acyltransferase family protein [Phenylobacterium sp.]|uniref:lysophospholipid acyltransferase family protein n=1 Tax=Phenylobacterium sp. TaxID=1871053 RepID=UPI0025DC83A1|nr:lysophospholipid acyltransferase family protein [Phenylobacterium sp.]
MRQNIQWRFEEWAYGSAQFLARRFPIDAVSDFGGWLFRTLGPLTSRHRTALINLRIVFPDATPAEMARMLGDQWEETGRWIAEFPTLDRIIADPSRVEVVGAERLTAIAAGKPVVFISGHFSSFEIMSAVIVHSGAICQITYRAMNNPYVDERLRESRWRYGVRLFAPKGLTGARALLRALGRGESVALMNDQKFNGGVAAPLFGLMAHTAPGPSSFALRFGIPIQPMSVQRIHKARFRVVVHDAFSLEDTGDSEADIETGVRRINAFIEERVLARPTEWFWVHKRWPNETYKRAA